MNKSFNQSISKIDLSKYLLSSSKIQDQEKNYQSRQSQSFLLETTEFMKDESTSNIEQLYSNIRDSGVFNHLEVTLSKIQDVPSQTYIENNSKIQQFQKAQTKGQIQQLQNICQILLKTNKDLVSKIQKIQNQKDNIRQNSFVSCRDLDKEYTKRDLKRNQSKLQKQQNSSVYSYKSNGINFGLNEFELLLKQYKHQITELKQQNKLLREENTSCIRTINTLKIQLKSLNSQNVKLFQDNNQIKEMSISLKQKLKSAKKQINVLKQSHSCKVINDEDQNAFNNQCKKISQAKSFHQAKNICETTNTYFNSQGKTKYQSVLNSFNSCQKRNLRQDFDKQEFQKKIRQQQSNNYIKKSPKTPCPTPNYIKFKDCNKGKQYMQQYQITNLKEPNLNELTQNRLQKILKQHEFQVKKKKQLSKYKKQKQISQDEHNSMNSIEDSFQKYFPSQVDNQANTFNYYQNLQESTVKTQKILQNLNPCKHKNNSIQQSNDYKVFSINQNAQNTSIKNLQNASSHRNFTKDAFSFRQIGKINNVIMKEVQNYKQCQGQNPYRIKQTASSNCKTYTPIYYSPCHSKISKSKSKSPARIVRNQKFSGTKDFLYR